MHLRIAVVSLLIVVSPTVFANVDYTKCADFSTTVRAMMVV